LIDTFGGETLDEVYDMHENEEKLAAKSSPMSWSRLSEQNLRVDKWSVCRG
jgi:hypothetical protein